MIECRSEGRQRRTCLAPMEAVFQLCVSPVGQGHHVSLGGDPSSSLLSLCPTAPAQICIDRDGWDGHARSSCDQDRINIDQGVIFAARLVETWNPHLFGNLSQ